MSFRGIGPRLRMNPLLRTCAWVALTTGAALGQDTVAPVAQPVDPNAVDTNTPPVAQPVSPGTDIPAPVAQPVDTPDAAGKPFTDTSAGAVTVVNVASARFDEATVAYHAGQYADAVRGFTDFVRSFPQDRRVEEALFHLAESYRNLGRTTDALAAYAYQVQHFPDGPFRGNAELRRGAILFDQHKYADAIPPLAFAADLSQGELQQAANYLLGRADIATQKEPEGRVLLQTLADHQPPGKLAGGAAQALAELDDAENHPADAVTYWQRTVALSKDPGTQSTAAARGGWSALAANQPQVAEKLFQKARQIGASGATRQVANTGLLRVLFEQKRYADWLKVYADEKDHLLASARSEILFDLGHVQFSLKQWPDAVVAFDAYLSEFGTQPGATNAAYERFLAAVQADPTQTLSQADAYLHAWPQSPYRPRVLLLEAQELSRQQKFADAVPVWETLAAVPAKADWPRREILLERARAYDQLHDWGKAANAYRAFIDESGQGSAKAVLSAEARLAVCLQNDGQSLAATEAWKAVQSQAPAGSPEQQVALESLGLIYAHGGPAQVPLLAATFKMLLDQFPQTKLRSLASFSVGDSFFQNRDYTGAEPYLLNARSWDPAAWMQPATQRLALGAYGRKDWTKLLGYTKEYDGISGAEKTAPLPAALFYSLAENARRTGDLEVAEDSYERVTILPDAGDLLAGAWWQLGEVEAARKEWASAVMSYQKYQQLKPETKNATVVLLALGRAQLGAGMLDAAKTTAQQALLGEPEGPNSAAARMLLAEIAFAAQSYAEAARMFATLAVLFDNPQTAPQAMARAADSFEKAGDAKSAADWREKLKAKFPQFQPGSYL
jgi:TolA-binding protein